jgi:hypothetical protein
MGGAMASNLAPKGFDARVYDLDPKPMEELAAAGAKPASSCREVGEHAEVLSVCVPADAHVEAVLLGEGGALAGMAAAFSVSGIGPFATRNREFSVSSTSVLARGLSSGMARRSRARAASPIDPPPSLSLSSRATTRSARRRSSASRR